MRSFVWQLILVIPLVIALKCLVRSYLLSIISQHLLPAWQCSTFWKRKESGSELWVCLLVSYIFVRMKHSSANSCSLIGLLLSFLWLCRHPHSSNITEHSCIFIHGNIIKHLAVNPSKSIWKKKHYFICCTKGNAAQGRIWAWGQGSLNSKSKPHVSLLTAEDEP